MINLDYNQLNQLESELSSFLNHLIKILPNYYNQVSSPAFISDNDLE